jgi:hypothetical protein
MSVLSRIAGSCRSRGLRPQGSFESVASPEELSPSPRRRLRSSDKKAAAEPDLKADGSVPDATAKAGAETRVATVNHCAPPNQAPAVSARADHGTVSVKPGKGRAAAVRR